MNYPKCGVKEAKRGEIQVQGLILVAKDIDDLQVGQAVNYQKSRVGGQEVAGGPEDNCYRHTNPSR